MKPVRKGLVGRLPGIPMEDWPEKHQQTFRASAQIMGWSGSYSARVAAALGQLYWIMRRCPHDDEWTKEPPGIDDWHRYTEALGKHYTATTALTYRELAAHGLNAVFAGQSIREIIDTNRAERKRLTRVPQDVKPARPTGRRRSLDVRDWPDDWRQRWQNAFKNEPSSLRELAIHEEVPSRGKGKDPHTWSDAYRSRVQRGLGLLAGWISFQQVDSVSKVMIRDFIADLAHQAPRSILSYLEEIHRGLLVLDLHPDPDWLAGEIAWLKRRAYPRNRQDKLIPLGQLRTTAMEHLDKVSHLPVSRQTAARYRDALILALLSYRPDRSADFHSLALGTNVQVGEEVTQLHVIQAKTGQVKVSNWPVDLEAALRRYLEVYRPLLSWERTENALWLSGKTGKPLSQSRHASILTQLTGSLFGRSLSPHFMRNIYATSIAEDAPGHLPDASLMLGHRDERSIAHYIAHARSVGAAKALDCALEEL